MRRRLGRNRGRFLVRAPIVWIVALGSLLALPAGSDDAGTASLSSAPRPLLHADSAALERSLLDATLGIAKDDTKMLRAGLDGMEKACRRLKDDESFPREVRNYDSAFHLTLDRARELAGAGDIEHSAQQFCWIESACRKCHEQARKAAIRAPGADKPPAP
jgi:hypothetical protein